MPASNYPDKVIIYNWSSAQTYVSNSECWAAIEENGASKGGNLDGGTNEVSGTITLRGLPTILNTDLLVDKATDEIWLIEGFTYDGSDYIVNCLKSEELADSITLT